MTEAVEDAALVRAEAGRLEREGRLGACRGFIQHGDVTVYAHVMSVALESCRMARRLERAGVRVDKASLVRGALLHDYFLYDWHYDGDGSHKLHGFTHPRRALMNALQDFELNEVERNSILRHMFPLTPIPPKYIEGYLVTMADKISATRETFSLARFSRPQLAPVPERLALTAGVDPASVRFASVSHEQDSRREAGSREETR